MLNDSKIVITGGTGSLGRVLVDEICALYSPRKLIIYSRDEYKQAVMSQEYSYPSLRFFIGDVRDLARLRQAVRGADYLIHAAALKRIPALEYNPCEAIKTNIEGSRNVVDACVREGVRKAVLVSTDKAVHPINLYGATKLCAEKLFTAANVYGKTVFTVVRYGNVINSRGSVIEKFMALKRKGQKTFPVTHPDMTRFWITLEDAAIFVLRALKSEQGTYVPLIPSMKITDIAKAIEPDCKIDVIGIRAGEKLHERLVADDETVFVYDPTTPGDRLTNQEISYPKASNRNHRWLTAEELRRSIL